MKIYNSNVKRYKERAFSGYCNPQLNKTDIKNGGNL